MNSRIRDEAETNGAGGIGMSIDTNEPHAMNKRLYAIDVALIGESKAPMRWQLNSTLWGWANYKGGHDAPIWNFKAEHYRRDPEAPALPSWDWHEAPDWAIQRGRKTLAWYSTALAHANADDRPPQAWFDATADMTRAEYESLRRLARGETAAPDSANFTPAQQAGFEVGDKAIVIENDSGFMKGQVVTLFYDDGSKGPLWRGRNTRFRNCDGASGAYAFLSSMQKAVPGDDGVLSGAALHRAIADAMDAGEKPDVFEAEMRPGLWQYHVSWHDLYDSMEQGLPIRRKPKTCHLIDANGVRHEWPEPMREIPISGTRFWLTFDGDTTGAHEPHQWDALSDDHDLWLTQRRCHAIREARDAHERALVAASTAEVTDV